MTSWSDSTNRRGSVGRVRSFAVPALVGLAFAFAGCGGGAPGPGVASIGSRKTTTVPERAARVPGALAADYAEALKYSQCMRSHGVAAFPDPNNAGMIVFAKGGPDDHQSTSPQDLPGYAGANKVCGHLLPNGGRPTSAQLAYIGSQLLKYAQCIRAHGVSSFPDPTISDRLIGFENVGPSLLTSAAFRRAQKSCSYLMAGGP